MKARTSASWPAILSHKSYFPSSKSWVGLLCVDTSRCPFFWNLPGSAPGIWEARQALLGPRAAGSPCAAGRACLCCAPPPSPAQTEQKVNARPYVRAWCCFGSGELKEQLSASFLPVQQTRSKLWVTDTRRGPVATGARWYFHYM